MKARSFFYFAACRGLTHVQQCIYVLRFIDFRMREFVLVLLIALVYSEDQGVYVTQTWNGGFHGHFTLKPSHTVHGWTAHLKFSKPVDKVEVLITFKVVFSGALLFKTGCKGLSHNFIYFLLTNIVSKHFLLAVANTL